MSFTANKDLSLCMLFNQHCPGVNCKTGRIAHLFAWRPTWHIPSPVENIVIAFCRGSTKHYKCFCEGEGLNRQWSMCISVMRKKNRYHIHRHSHTYVCVWGGVYVSLPSLYLWVCVCVCVCHLHHHNHSKHVQSLTLPSVVRLALELSKLAVSPRHVNPVTLGANQAYLQCGQPM